MRFGHQKAACLDQLYGQGLRADLHDAVGKTYRQRCPRGQPRPFPDVLGDQDSSSPIDGSVHGVDTTVETAMIGTLRASTERTAPEPW